MRQKLRYLFTILSCILLLSNTSSAQDDKISYFSYQNLTYSNNKSFVTYSIRQKVNDSISIIKKDYILPDSLTEKLLAGIDSIQILKVKSNDRVVIDGVPFTFEYQIANQPYTKVHGHPFGMQEQERNILNRFISFISQFTNYYHTHFRDSLPHGEYYKDKGMLGATIELKRKGVWYDPNDYPLVIFEGEIISHENISKYTEKSDQYNIEVMKGAEATAIYGTQASRGVIQISSK